MGLFGDNYSGQVAGMSKQMRNLWNMYTGPMMARYAQQVQNPWTAQDTAQMNTLQAGTLQDYQQGDAQLQQSLAGRGLGRSSMTQNGLGSLWNAYGQTMSRARQQQQQAVEARRQQAQAALLGAASGMGQGAMQGYQAAQQMGGNGLADILGLLGQAGQVAGSVGLTNFLAQKIGSGSRTATRPFSPYGYSTTEPVLISYPDGSFGYEYDMP